MESTGPGIVFWIIALVMIVSAFMVVTLRNIFHCALFLILSLFSVAGIFVLLHAEFLAAAQVLIYVGAVAILVIFAIMLTSNLSSTVVRQTSESAVVAGFVCLVFVVGVGVAVMMQKGTPSTDPSVVRGIWHNVGGDLPEDNVMTIGKYLMTDFMLPFEVVSILILSAMIGAIMLARKERS